MSSTCTRTSETGSLEAAGFFVQVVLADNGLTVVQRPAPRFSSFKTTYGSPTAPIMLG